MRMVMRDVFVVALAGVVMLFGAAFNTDTGWTLALCAAGLLAIGVVSLGWPLRLVQATSRSLATAEAPVALTLHGRAWFAQLAVRGGVQPVSWAPVWGRAQGSVAVRLERGRYHRLPLTLVATDAVGLLQKARPLTLREPLLVGPRREAALCARLYPVLRAATARLQTTAGAPSFDLIGLRPYVAGDPIQAIDWKLTAKHGAAIVRQTRSATQVPWQAVLIADSAQFELQLALVHTLASRGLWRELTALTAAGPVVAPSEEWFATVQPDAVGAAGLAALPGLPTIVFCPEAAVAAVQTALAPQPVLAVALTAAGPVVMAGGRSQLVRG
ncbi:DUF58 domain-containing protein [Lacticaseibacillus parakribbianus]|uniref:DUF58 domain-containing protein n=1 Tax=Lacticaseibacillus parakribbianus TaxID=2970927 RepID=UPI0021CB4D26|nr:DUF58 domain-containing protein [Lacticaseibacillus parakribbianus]